MEFKVKKELRRLMIEKRNSMDLNKKAEWDNKITSQLIESSFYENAKIIFTYVSFGSEVDTHYFIKYALNDKKVLCVPKIISKNGVMKAFRINSFKDLKAGSFGIPEPEDCRVEITPSKMNLILMPGLVFDRGGERVGYGAGFYDRFLYGAGKKASKVALAYDFQLLNKIPSDKFDIKADAIITNKEIIIL
ncbi:MAG: 5-formyltetrahydrofolate cyclo-ligase [Clostridiales bacterium]|nr:5-formyltetrahydrofolate cyclo-ligase [Clostridiales bacterium]